jgi:hypothetical protein
MGWVGGKRSVTWPRCAPERWRQPLGFKEFEASAEGKRSGVRSRFNQMLLGASDRLLFKTCEFLIQPTKNGLLVFDGCTSYLSQKMNPIRLLWRSILQTFVTVRAYRAKVRWGVFATF